MSDQEKLKEVIYELHALLEFNDVEVEVMEGLIFQIGKAKLEIGSDDNMIEVLREYSEHE